MMAFQADPSVIRWRLHLTSPPDEVFKLLSTNTGRALFWAQAADEQDGAINFIFPNGARWRGEILDSVPNRLYRLVYYGGSVTTFELEGDGTGGTDLTITDEGVPPEFRSEVIAGWVSVLLALKAMADFSVDIRNHDPVRIWDHGFVDN